jgi:hypothetical protein
MSDINPAELLIIIYFLLYCLATAKDFLEKHNFRSQVRHEC